MNGTGGVRRLARTLARHSAVRFLITGGLSAAVDTGLLVLLHGVLDVWLPVATYVAVAVSFGVNFLINRIWSFQSFTGMGRQLYRYLILAAGNWLFTVGMVSALAWLGLHYLAAKLVTLAIAAVLNYFGYRLWVFKQAPVTAAATATPPPAVPAPTEAPNGPGNRSDRRPPRQPAAT